MEYAHDEQPREISAIMDIPVNSVSVGVTRAKQRLTDCLNRRFPGLFRNDPFWPHDT